MSVKGGKHVNPAMVRDLIGTVEAERAEMGILLMLTTPTRGMTDAANKSGTYVHELTGRTFPRVQIITVPDIMAGKKVDMPVPMLPYVKAKGRAGHQLSILD